MSLSIKDTHLRPHVAELSGLITQELGVHTSQIRLLNLASSGNGSLITWSIYPDKSKKYITNTTARHIIGDLAENSVHLPGTFGSYKLYNWKIEPPMKRSWPHQPVPSQLYLVVVMAVILTLVLVYGFLFIFKWRQQIRTPYKPVDNQPAVLEQGLQLV